MSFRPPFPNPNATFTSHNNNFVPPNTFVFKSNDHHQTTLQSNFTNHNMTNRPFLPNAFVPTAKMHHTSNPKHDILPPSNQFYNNTFNRTQQSVNRPRFLFPNSIGPCTTGNTPNFNPRPNNFNQYYSSQPLEQHSKGNEINNFHTNSDNARFNNELTNASNQVFSIGQVNTNCNSPSVINFQEYQNNICQGTVSTIPKIFNSFPVNENTNNRTVDNSFGVVNYQSPVPANDNSLLVPSVLSNVPPAQWVNNCFLNVPPPNLEIGSSYMQLSNNVPNLLSKKELKLQSFLAKFSAKHKINETKITVPEFRSALKDAFSIMNLLSEKKSKLRNLIDASDSDWNFEMQSINSLKKQLSEMCSLVNSSVHLNNILKKLKCIKKKRDQKKKTKLNKLSEKIKAEQNRKELHQAIDKWLDNIKEKNLKLKREVEMKKEADFILLEVRRKIQEANRTIEKLKVFEKLRNARQTNSAQRGLHILAEHNENFEMKVSILKKTMLKQLADYEAEEKALKVMLETEQEGQLEEKVQWELNKLKSLQQKRLNHIKECLFGVSEDPLPSDDLYLFHKFHTSANNSIENLVQIRHHWDMQLAAEGECVPQQWIVPVAPSSSSWEQCLKSTKS